MLRQQAVDLGWRRLFSTHFQITGKNTPKSSNDWTKCGPDFPMIGTLGLCAENRPRHLLPAGDHLVYFPPIFMTQPLTIIFNLTSFNPEKFGLAREQAADPDLFAEAVSGVIAKIFKTIGQDAFIDLSLLYLTLGLVIVSEICIHISDR
jgi:hypothetical protein